MGSEIILPLHSSLAKSFNNTNSKLTKTKNNNQLILNDKLRGMLINIIYQSLGSEQEVQSTTYQIPNQRQAYIILQYTNEIINHNNLLNGYPLRMQIIQLQQLLKAKRKFTSIPQLNKIICEVQGQNGRKVNLTLQQKGIIIQLLAQLCFKQFSILKTILSDEFSTFNGFPVEKRKTTVRKPRKGGQNIGNTATRKKREDQMPQKVRNQMLSLEELLQRQLATPNSTQSNSQKSETLLKVHQTNIHEEMQSLRNQFVTPLKIDEPKANQPDLDQYRQLLCQTKKSARQEGKKAGQPMKHRKTKKKEQRENASVLEINTDISLHFTQNSIKNEIEEILRMTKKKKNEEKENLFQHPIFAQFQQSVRFGPLTKIIQFNKQISNSKMKLLLSQQILSDNQSQKQQINSILSPFAQIADTATKVYSSTPRKPGSVAVDSEKQIQKHGSIDFLSYSLRHGLDRAEKTLLFYEFLCQNEKFQMSQQRVYQFGQISISFQR